MSSSSWLPGLLGITTVQSDGTSVTPRAALNFVDFTVTSTEGTDSIDVEVPAASTSTAGSMSAADKTKLDGIQTQGSAVAVSAFDIDWSAGSVFTKTLAAGATALTFSNATSGKVIVVRITGAASTLTWPTVRWAAGTPPTQTASGTDVYTFVHDGTNIYGSVVQAMA